MTIVQFPPPAARQEDQRDGIAAALVRGGVKPKMAVAVSENVWKRLAVALEGPDIAVRFHAGMRPADVAEQLDAFAVNLVAPLLLEIVKLEAELHRTNKALAAATARAHAR